MATTTKSCPFTDEQIKIITASGLTSVSEDRTKLHYSKEFKILAAYREFFFAQSPRQIYEAYGIPMFIVGKSRIDSNACIWRSLYTKERVEIAYNDLIKERPDLKIDETNLTRQNLDNDPNLTIPVINRIRSLDDQITNLKAALELQKKVSLTPMSERDIIKLIHSTIEERNLNNAASLLCETLDIKLDNYNNYLRTLKKIKKEV